MFLDDEIVQLAKSADWTKWQTRSSVELKILDIVTKQFISKSDLLKTINGNDNDLIIEITKIKRMYNLAMQRLAKNNIHISLTWESLVLITFKPGPLSDTLINLK